MLVLDPFLHVHPLLYTRGRPLAADSRSSSSLPAPGHPHDHEGEPRQTQSREEPSERDTAACPCARDHALGLAAVRRLILRGAVCAMQNDHDDPSAQGDASMHFGDMLPLDPSSMADFGGADFLGDLDIANFDDASLTSPAAHFNPSQPDQSFAQLQQPQQDNNFASIPDADVAAAAAAIINNAHRNSTGTKTGDEDDEEDEDTAMTGIGAGPLPTGFGVSLPANAGNTLTEFTKRRNWSQRVVEEIKDFLHILTPDGRIMYVSPSTPSLTGYEPHDLVGKVMANYVHPDDAGMFMREFHESIASGHPLRFFYRLRRADGSYAIFESHGHPHFSSDVTAGYPGAASHGVSFCRGFFIMSRPYPSKNAALLDSFLEHKIESERLKKRIADLKREELDDANDQHSAAIAVSAPSSGTGPDRASGSITPGGLKVRRPSHSGESPSVVGSGRASDYSSMPPPAKPTTSNWALTQRNLDEALSASRPDSINDKMARYEGSNHLDSIEMMTGLRYRDGERAKGISTGAASPMLIRGDQGIDYPVDRSGRRGSSDRVRTHNDSPSRAFGGVDSERKKKIKVADEYVCTDCGTLDSPEWRRGPNGPKTLCNACGLRWAKQEKKRSGTATGSKLTPNGNDGGDLTAGNGGSPPGAQKGQQQSSNASPNNMAFSAPRTGSMPQPQTQAQGKPGMPIFTGNPGSMPPSMSVSIPQTQGMLPMGAHAGMVASPMSGMSPMTPHGMAGMMPGMNNGANSAPNSAGLSPANGMGFMPSPLGGPPQGGQIYPGQGQGMRPGGQ